ncbi:bifunctional UDP-sugar hydrolase/5'-nucleotidase UshA [Psychromonas sp. B3M02]|uniref:bifunctional UDP-sugar hydrolase/5'-nucleotidase UshA n=1 Tax=Psychromonas sp. B3M02 TaxID=2267226 RepID=UPI001C68A4C0|nr:bifunctional UDP-sugar hydrolase/5'-nucleotidase UshA [Psychromonas sp. B3M02]
MRIITKTLLLSALSFSLLGCSTVVDKTWEQDKVYNITVLHTNDHHGRFWQNRYGEYGMAARKTLIDSIRSEVEDAGGSVLLLSGGDINTGVPESDLQNAEPDFKGMSLIGYDAMAIGNHEFDNPLAILKQQEEWANFPLLSANIYDKKTNTRLFQPYQMFDLGGVKTAVIGLTTEDTAKVGNPEYVAGIDFKDPTTEARKVIAEVERNEHPDLIFAVTHMGHYQNAFYGVNAPGDVTLARALPEGALDMIVGGHSQEPVCMEGPNVVDTGFKPGDDCVPDKQNGTYIMQAHEWGKYVGRADYQFKNGVLTLVNYRLIPVNLVKKVKVNGESKRVLVEDKIEQDPSLLAFLTPFQENGQAELGNAVAESDAKLEGDRNKVRFQQTNLGRLVAKAQKERAKADFGVVNSGGVRDSIEAGTITYKDVLKVQPFGNQLTYVDMSGKEILEYLNAVATKPVDTGAYAQFYGISMTVGKTAVSKVKVNGKNLDLTEQYRFSIPSFNAAGGDGYPNITAHPGFVNTGFVDAEVLKEYLESHSPLKVEEYQPAGEMVYQN